MKDKVYYDESCYVCSLEINTIRKRGEACGIEFIDISNPDSQTSTRHKKIAWIADPLNGVPNKMGLNWTLCLIHFDFEIF